VDATVVDANNNENEKGKGNEIDIPNVLTRGKH